MPAKSAIADLQKEHRLTEAEALWVLRHDGDTDDLVTQVKAMRIGPSAYVEPVTVTADPDADALAEIEPEPFVEWTDEQIVDANAADLAAYVKAVPSDAERVARIEGSREGGARKTVLDAVSDVAEEG